MPSTDAELVLRARNPDLARSTAGILFVFMSLPTILGVLAGRLFGVAPAIAIVVGTIGFMLWRRQRLARLDVRLGIEAGKLSVWGADGTLLLADVPIEGLDDVVMDSKTTRMVVESNDMSLPLRYTNLSVGPVTDLSRVQLVGRLDNGEDFDIVLTMAHLSRTEALEWFTEVRRFLRRHGWVPASERQNDPAEGQPTSTRESPPSE